MGAAAVTMSDAWRAYDAFIGSPNITFADEPSGIEQIWRSLTQHSAFSPKVWNDAYLAAFAQLAGLELITFDRGFTQYPSIRVTMLP